VRPYGSLQFSLNKITKAITYVDSQGSHTVNPSDFNNWFAAGQNMIVGAEKHGLGATGTSQVLDAIYTALGAEYKISAPSGSAHDQAPGGMEAVKYPNVIFVQGADGTRYYLDLVNKIAYAGTYGQNGASKNDPSQNLLFNLCVQQMLNNANVYDQNSFLSVTDKQNLEKIIALLKPQIPTVAWGASDYNLSVSMDGKTLQFVDKRANGYNYLYNSSTKKITNLNTNPPTIIDPILNHSDWLNAMNMMIAQAVFVRDHYTPASDRSRVQSLIDLLNQQL